MYQYHFDRVKSETYDGKFVDYRLFYYAGGYESLDGALQWLKKTAKPEDVVAAPEPQWAYLRTGLKAVMPPLELNPERAQALLDSVPAAYILLDFETAGQFTFPYVLHLVEGDPRAWKPVYSDKKALLRVYERVGSEDRYKATQ